MLGISKLICGPGLLRLFGELRMKFTQGAAPAVFRFFKPSSNHFKSNFQRFSWKLYHLDHQANWDHTESSQCVNLGNQDFHCLVKVLFTAQDWTEN
jgi:hypothetical protein